MEGNIGLMGYNCATGLGEVNRQLCKHLGIKHWLLINNRGKKTLQAPEGVQLSLNFGTVVNNCEVLLFAENPFGHEHVLERFKAKNGRVMCVPMWEWLDPPEKKWLKDIDLFICPTKCCFNKFKDELQCVHLDWPVDCDRFPFTQRKTCERFLFIDGNGGWQGRKGLDVIKKVLEMWPEMPLTICSQKCPWIETVHFPNLKLKGEVQDSTSLYAHDMGDVLLAPHSMDGIGLEVLEALSSGMPVVVTQGKPWDEYDAVASIKSKVRQVRTRRLVDWHDADPVDLHRICRNLLGKNLEVVSLEGRKWAEARSWNVLGERWKQVVLGNMI